MKTNGILSDAFIIASENLQDCLTDIGVICGTHHFTDLWARDSLFAALGLTSSKFFPETRLTLETFLKYQKPSGQIPYRILRSPFSWVKYRGQPIYYQIPRPDFRSHQTGGTVYDGGLLTIILVKNYIDKSRDLEFLKRIYPKLQLAANYYSRRFNGDLIREWFMCEWADAILKSGKTLYTNSLYYKALTDMSCLAGILHQDKDSEKFSLLCERIKQKIQDEFWLTNYYCDWIDYKKHKYFYSLGNMLAVWFGVSDRQQAEKVFQFTQKYCWNEFVLEENYPKYPWRRIPFWNYLIGMADYHNRGCLWLQPGLFYVLALLKHNQVVKAKFVLNQIAKLIVKHQGVYEIYEKNWQPVKRFFYKAEHPFAWSAGLYIYAYNLLFEL